MFIDAAAAAVARSRALPAGVYRAGSAYRQPLSRHKSRLSAIALTRLTDWKNPYRRGPAVFRDCAAAPTLDHMAHDGVLYRLTSASLTDSWDAAAVLQWSSTSAVRPAGAGNADGRPTGRRRLYTCTTSLVSSSAESRCWPRLSAVAARRRDRLWKLSRPLRDLRLNEPQPPRPTAAISVRCDRRCFVRGGRSGGGSVSNRVSITYRHFSPSNWSGSAGNGPLIIGFFLFLL